MDVLLLIFGRLRLPLSLFFTPNLVLGVRAFEVVQLGPSNFNGALGEGVQEHPVVGNEQNGPRVMGQKRFQPLDAFDVQVVGGLVKQQKIWFHQQELGQFHPHLPPSTVLGHGA